MKKRGFKKILAVVMASCLLAAAVPPAESHALGSATMGQALFEMLSGFYGVVMSSGQKNTEYNAFKEYCAGKLTDVKDFFESLEPANIKQAIITKTAMSAVKNFWEKTALDHGGSLDGGKVVSLSSNVHFQSGYKNTEADKIFQNLIRSGKIYELTGSGLNSSYVIMGFSSLRNLSSGEYVSLYVYRSSDLADSSQYYNYLVYDSSRVGYVRYSKFGGGYGLELQKFKEYSYKYDPYTKEFRYSSSSSSVSMRGNDFCFTYPVANIAFDKIDSNMSDFFANAEILEMTPFLTSDVLAGKYDQWVADRVIDKTVTLDQAAAITDVIDTTADKAKEEDEEGNLVYVPDFADQLINSLIDALVDQGVISKEEVEDKPTDPGKPPVVVPSDPGAFGLDLKELFPFCIPFDIYDMLNALCAEPSAPRFDWTFNSVNGKKEKITIDLSVLDPVAQILRTAEVIAFSVGLALKTRDLIRG